MLNGHVPLAGRGTHRRRWTAVAVVMLAAFAVGACSDDDEGDEETSSEAVTTTTAGEAAEEPAEEEEEEEESVLGPSNPASGEPITIGFITDGQNASTDQSIELDVAEAAVEYINEHRAGYAGRPVELVICEAQLDPARGADCANQMVEEGVPIVAVGTTGVVESVWTPLHEAGIPTLFFAASGDTVLGDTENTFAVSNPQAGNISLPIAVAEENDLEKVTVIAIDVPAAYAGYEGSGAQAFEDAGIELEVVRIAAGTADMTPQLQPVFAGEPGVIHIIGNDAFCISAYQAMIALGFDGPQTGITQCVTDATRQAIPGDFLEGMNIASAAPVGIEDESTELYRTVVETYGDVDIDTSRIAGVGTFLVLNALDVGLEGLEGEITPASIIATLRAMEEADLPGGGGIRFRCNGNALPALPAVCASGGVSGVLDGTGNVEVFEPTPADPIPD